MIKKKTALTVADLGEKRIISEIIKPMCNTDRVLIGVGDDSAMLNIPKGYNLLISTDKIPEDLLSLQLGLMDPYHHGRYLAVVNISDIAAMGGKPVGLLPVFALPNDFKINYFKKFYRGFVDGGNEWKTPIIGGDTGWGTAPCFSATCIGIVKKGRVLRRDGAKINDSIFVTGYVGLFSTALIYFIIAKPNGLKLPKDEENYLKNKLIMPMANVSKGLRLANSCICTSCMDITDGVARTIYELSSISNVKYKIIEELLPIHHTTLKIASFLNIEPRKIIFGIGLDLELLGTISIKKNALPATLRKDIVIIGKVYNGNQNILITKNNNEIPIPVFGWQHFSGRAIDVVKKTVNN